MVRVAPAPDADPLASSWPPPEVIPVNRLPGSVPARPVRLPRAGRIRGAVGRAVMLLAAAAAGGSFFLNWVDNGVISVSGFGVWAFVLLVPYLYPLIQLFCRRPIRKAVAVPCALAAAALTGAFIVFQRIETAERVLHVAAEGAYVFLLASVFFCVGLLLYRPAPAGHALFRPRLPGGRRGWLILGAGTAALGGLTAVLVLLGAGPGNDSVPAGEVCCLKGHTDWVYRVTFSPDGRRALSCGYGRTVRLWDVETGQELRRFRVGLAPVHAVTFSPAGLRALCGTDEGDFGLWDLETASELRRLAGHKADVLSAAFSPHNDLALSGSDDHTLRLWDLITGKELRCFQGHFLWVNCVAFSADGRQALSGSLDKTVRLWDLETGAELRRCRGHRKEVRSVAFSPDGRFALSASEDKTVRLWDLETGEELRCFKGHTQPVNCAVFTPDGLSVLSGSDDGTVRLWDVVSGRQEYCYEGHTGWVHSVAVSPDGRYAASGGQDKTVRFWALPR